MSLIASLNISKTALQVNQAALQVTSNNISNAGDPDYTREIANLSPAETNLSSSGFYLGNGVDLSSVQRQIDDALEARLRSSTSDNQSASTLQDYLNRIDTSFNELGDQDLSTQMSKFFGDWSTLANNPSDTSQQQVVLQDGQTLATQIQSLNQNLVTIQNSASTDIKSLAANADSLATQIAALNKQIVATGSGGAQNNALLDQRDAAINKLSQLMDVHTIPSDTGAVNVYVGSEPLVMGNESGGIVVKQTTVNGQSFASLTLKSGVPLAITSGQIGGLFQVQNNYAPQTIQQLNTFASGLISQLNTVYSQGQASTGFSTVTSANAVSSATIPLSQSTAGLATPTQNGSLVVYVTNKTTGASSTALIQIGNATTLTSLASSLNGIGNISATVSGNKLNLSADNNYQITFDQNNSDSSNVLASLGINTFFSGNSAQDISVNGTITDDPSLLATGVYNGAANQTALNIAALQTNPPAGSQSITDIYQGMITQSANNSSTAKNNATAATTVQETLQSQHDSLSGVDIDEEAVNLIKQQRAFQGAARVVSAIDQMMQTLLQMT